MAPTSNRHAVALVAGRHGLLVEGPSGSGKTGLALAMVAQMAGAGRFAALVSDDQVLLSVAHGRLLARAPAAIAGLAEIRGVGIVAVPHCGKAVIDRVLRLVPGDGLDRMPDSASVTIAGIALPCLAVPERDPARGVAMACAWLEPGQRWSR